MKTLAAILIAALAWTGMAAPLEARPHQRCPDLLETVAHFGTYRHQPSWMSPEWDRRYDLNHSGNVTISDIILAIRCNFPDA